MAVYAQPYDRRYPVVCMDESCKQAVGEFLEPIPAAAGRPERIDHEDVRRGETALFLEGEPLTGLCHIQVSLRRSKNDWAHWIEERYPEAQFVVLVLDNLNTNGIGAPHETLPAAQARRLAERLETHNTPNHESWLNMAEIELSALNGHCLNRRIPDRKPFSGTSPHGKAIRNNRSSKIRGILRQTTPGSGSSSVPGDRDGMMLSGFLPQRIAQVIIRCPSAKPGA